MYVILVYDLKADRTDKIHKKCSQYLTWKQNSLFEGELTKAQYSELSSWINEYVGDSESVIIYTLRTEDAVNKNVFGDEPQDSTIL